MDLQAFVADLAQAGITLNVNIGGGLNAQCALPEALTDTMRDMIKTHKTALVALVRQREATQATLPELAISAAAQEIQAAWERLLTDAEKRNIAKAFHVFRDQQGRTLVGAGWKRESVFSGTDPLAATTVGDVHRIIWLLMDGAKVMGVTQKAIYFRLADSSRTAWLRGGCFVADPYLQQLELTTLIEM